MKSAWLFGTSLVTSGIALVLVFLLFIQDLFTVNWFGIHLSAIAGFFSICSIVSWFIAMGSELEAQVRKIVIGLFVVAGLCYVAGIGLSVTKYVRAQRYQSLAAPDPARTQRSQGATYPS